jgi:hypothetical protein
MLEARAYEGDIIGLIGMHLHLGLIVHNGKGWERKHLKIDEMKFSFALEHNDKICACAG